jgi:hypothetical protein
MLAGSVSASPAYLEAFLPLGEEMNSVPPATASSLSESELISESKFDIEESFPLSLFKYDHRSSSQLPFPTRVVSEVGSFMGRA